MSEPSILIVGPEPRKRGGRPRAYPDAGLKMSSVSTWVWSGHHDALIKAAEQKGVSLSAHVRDVLARSVKA